MNRFFGLIFLLLFTAAGACAQGDLARFRNFIHEKPAVDSDNLRVNRQQKEFILKNYTQEEGLPSNETYYVYEDSKHYIWIATDLGVVRYNGNKFEHFSLPDNVVFKILEDSKGRIWFFSHKALLAYFENEKIYPFPYNNIISKRIEKIHIIDCHIDDGGTIFLNSILDSNYVISPDGSIKAFNHEIDTMGSWFFDVDQVENGRYFTQLTQNSGDVEGFSITVKRRAERLNFNIPLLARPFAHFGAIEGLNKAVYFFGGPFLVKLNHDGTYKVKKMSSKILCLKMIRGNLWIGMYNNGVAILSPELENTETASVLSSKSVTCINSDYEDGLWLSTLENGAYYIKNTSISHLTDNDASNTYVSRLLNYKDTVLIFSKFDGLYRYAKSSTDFFYPLKNQTAVQLFTRGKTLFFAGAITPYNSNVKIKDPYFDNICTYNAGETKIAGHDTIVSSRSNHVVIFKSMFINDNAPHTPIDHNYYQNWKIILPRPATLFIDAAGYIWGGTNDGLYRSTISFDTMLKFKASSALLGNGISCIKELKKGMLAVGIRLAGIALLTDTTIVANITEKEGLLSDKVRCLLFYKDQLWAGTAKGISVIKFHSYLPLQYSIINIGKNDGFYNLTINQLTQFKDKVVAATSNGIYFFENPEEILNRNLPVLPFYINTISSYKGDTTGIANIALPYSKNRLTLKFSAVSFNSYETIKYMYRFDHGDTAWHSTSNPELLLENLEPGTYDLQMKAIIANQHRQSVVRKLSITVEKPWWQDNWFRLLTVLLTAGIVYWYINHRVKKIKREEKRKTALNSKLAELEQTALRSQMNPHFIFNCLTSIQQLIVTGNKTDANEYLVKFARLIRKTLELSAHPFISIREETEYLNEYLFLEHLRLSDHFNFTITVAETINTDRTYIPNMMIQPVVENCIRHGIKSLENKKGHIAIAFSNSQKHITCTVTDNGVGRTGHPAAGDNAFTKHKSYGMDIIRKRLQTFAEFDEQDSSIEIKDMYDESGLAAGTQVILHLPFKNSL